MGPLTEPIVINRRGCTIHGWRKGNPDRPLLICLHGAGVDHRLFSPQVGPLAAAGFQVLAVDLRGHGASAMNPYDPIEVDDVVEDVIAFMDHLKVNQAILLGQSFGGLIAQHVANRYPDRIRALGVVGANEVFGFTSSLDLWLLKMSATWFAWWPWEDLSRRSAHAAAFTPQGRQYCMEAFTALGKPRFVQIWRCATESLAPDLSVQLTMPIFLGLGQFDRTGKVSQSMMRWADETPHTVFYRIPCAGHIANYDNPGYFNSVFIGFLKTRGLTANP